MSKSAWQVDRELVSDKANNIPVTEAKYIQHGNDWLDNVLNAATTALNAKADKSYVDIELAKKASTEAVATIDAKLNGKADASVVSQLQATVNTKADASTVSALSERVTANTTGISEANSRIDQIVALPEGSTTGDAELIDIRTKADGSVAASAGAAVREQVTNLKSELSKLKTGYFDLSNSKFQSVSSGKIVEQRDSILTEEFKAEDYWGTTFESADGENHLRLIVSNEAGATSGLNPRLWANEITIDSTSMGSYRYFRVQYFDSITYASMEEAAAIIKVNNYNLQSLESELIKSEIKRIDNEVDALNDDLADMYGEKLQYVDVALLAQGVVDDRSKYTVTGEAKGVSTDALIPYVAGGKIELDSNYKMRIMGYTSPTTGYAILPNVQWVNSYTLPNTDEYKFFRIVIMTNSFDSGVVHPEDLVNKIKTDIKFLWNEKTILGLNEKISNAFKPKNIILDTDWWTDSDDSISIRVMKWAESQKKIKLKGIVVDAVRDTSIRSLSAYLDYEGYSNIEIGADKEATDYSWGNYDDGYHGTVISNWNHYRYSSVDDVLDSTSFYRKVLSELEEGEKIDIVCVGYTNALAKLIDSKSDEYSMLSGKALMLKKVNHVWIMGGGYVSNDGGLTYRGNENNFNRNSRARMAANLVADFCPVPITYLGYEVGVSVLVGGQIKDVIGTDDLLYKILLKHGGESEANNGRSAWDPMTMLLATNDIDVNSGYDFVYGSNGVNSTEGYNVFTVNSNGKDRFVIKKHSDSWYRHILNSIVNKCGWY